MENALFLDCFILIHTVIIIHVPPKAVIRPVAPHRHRLFFYDPLAPVRERRSE